MEEVGAQVAAAPMFIHQALNPMGRKRDLYYYQTSSNLQLSQPPPQHHHLRTDDWNPRLWDWDSTRFVAKPLDQTTAEVFRLGNDKPNKGRVGDESLELNLGGGLNLNSAEEPTTTTLTLPPVSRASKRVRSGSPGGGGGGGGGGGNYPMCQVDNCKEDLTSAKDYHRRHKVCELHSKASKALVGKQMQRFCQQCSRFHPLSEFDEGKRSCRRRLAGHNRRRRKTQPDDVMSRVLVPGNPGNRDTNSSTTTGNVDLVALLTALACAQGKNEDKCINSPSVPDRDQLVQILNKINSLPLPLDLASRLQNIGGLTRRNPDHPLVNHQNDLNGASPSTMDLLNVLSATLTTSSPDALAILSQRSGGNGGSDKTKMMSPDRGTAVNLEKTTLEFPSGGGERSSSTHQSPSQDSDCHVQDARSSLSLQLFTSSPEDESRPTVASSRKYYSSDSSNPLEDRSASSSPLVQTLFPMQSSPEEVRSKRTTINKKVNTDTEGIGTGCLPLELFSGSSKRADKVNIQSFPYHSGYTSSGSDHSPSSLNSDAQDRTGRIMFKLFDKDPSHFPGTLRTQIYKWLSSSPSEMESYIRPGCVILSLYVSMSAAAWQQLERNLVRRVICLLQDSHSDFWRNSRFLVNTGKQLASHKDGRIRLSKSWRTWSSPELISVSPLAVEPGKEISLVLRGRNLTNEGTKIRCAYMGGYASVEVTRSTSQGTLYDEMNLNGFQVQGAHPGVLGRCFIEVENGFKGNGFPVIIADATICKELKHLEYDFQLESKASDDITEDAHGLDSPRSREEVLHFLNELGWLFQRKKTSSTPEGSNFSFSRFKFLLVFSVERDCSALAKTLLDMLVERHLDLGGLPVELLETLSETQLLNRAVKRKCTKMVEMLLHYSISVASDASKKYIFPPNLAGPGGITALHMAACTSGSDDMIDLLTNDPQKIGLLSWNSLLDANGQSPYNYAAMRNNHTYNTLVARKLADRRNGQVSLNITSEIERSGLSRLGFEVKRSCASCATVAMRYHKRVSGSRGLFPTPLIHSMLAIATVCVCVCVFMHAFPIVKRGSHFNWTGLDYGSM